MSGQTGQSLATFLLSVPVAAIGLMAVFGIPQFAAVIAAQRGETGEDPLDELDEFRHASADILGGRDPNFPPSSSRDDDHNAPRWDSGPQGFADDASQEDRSPRPANFWGERRGSEFENNPAPREGFRETDAWGQPSTIQTTTLTWSEARLQLADLGVDDFHLEAGSVPETFTFVAVFTPGAQPDVTYRFEAEASEPLLAVEDVVAQIEDWLANRFASNGQSHSANFPTQRERRW
jgi:hypothetical protein